MATKDTPIIPFWKDKLLPSIIGALIGAILTQAVALYALNKNLQVAQNRDRIYILRASIGVLHSLQSEMATNTKLLIAERPELKFVLEKKQMDVLSIPLAYHAAREFRYSIP